MRETGQLPVRIAIVGCGRISDLHVRAYQHEPRAEVYAVCDTDGALAQGRADEWGIHKVYTDYDQLLDDPEVDAVELLTPTRLHAQMTIKAAKAGKHVSVQKPMALNLPDAQAMIKACAEANVVLKICENYVFYPPLVRAKHWIEEGKIGIPLNVNIRMIGANQGGWHIPPDAWKWRLEEAKIAGGLQTFDHGHHMFASAHFLLGEIDKIHGWIQSHDGIVDAPATFHWNYKHNKAQGSVQFIHAPELEIPSKYYSNDEWFEIVGSRGIIWINQCTASIRGELPALSIYHQGKTETVPLSSQEIDWQAGFDGALQNFVDAIEGRDAPKLSGEQGLSILSYALAGQKSHKYERPVYIEEMLDTNAERVYKQRKKRDIEKLRGPKRSWWDNFFGNHDSLAKECPGLMEAFPRRFDPEKVPGWEAKISVEIDGEYGGEWTYTIQNGVLDVKRGLDANAGLHMIVDAGMWAAILKGKSTAQSAFLQGKLKLQGNIEWALSLKKAFDL
tara:strand:+ start:15348 stop:16856 length:1509 start_codon:yes stop_codon:yes gene_type:complete